MFPPMISGSKTCPGRLRRARSPWPRPPGGPLPPNPARPLHASPSFGTATNRPSFPLLGHRAVIGYGPLGPGEATRFVHSLPIPWVPQRCFRQCRQPPRNRPTGLRRRRRWRERGRPPEFNSGLRSAGCPTLLAVRLRRGRPNIGGPSPRTSAAKIAAFAHHRQLLKIVRRAAPSKPGIPCAPRPHPLPPASRKPPVERPAPQPCFGSQQTKFPRGCPLSTSVAISVPAAGGRFHEPPWLWLTNRGFFAGR